MHYVSGFSKIKFLHSSNRSTSTRGRFCSAWRTPTCSTPTCSTTIWTTWLRWGTSSRGRISTTWLWWGSWRGWLWWSSRRGWVRWGSGRGWVPCSTSPSATDVRNGNSIYMHSTPCYMYLYWLVLEQQVHSEMSCFKYNVLALFP